MNALVSWAITILYGVIELLENAGAIMPLVILLTLIADNKKKVLLPEHFPITAIKINMLVSLAALAGMIWQAFSLLENLAPDGADMRTALCQPAFLPWTASCVLWCLGCLCLLALISAGKRSGESSGGTRHLGSQSSICVASIAAAASFFCAFMVINWPFAGLPAGMSFSRAFFTIFKNAFHGCYAGFTPAGAILLSLCAHMLQKSAIFLKQPEKTDCAVRWFAFWGIAGSFPHWIQNCGFIIGLAFHYGLSENMAWKACTLGMMTISIACWVAIFVMGRKHLLILLSCGWLTLLLFYCMNRLPSSPI